MKLDTEYSCHHTYPNGHAAKAIVRNDNLVILPRDDHFMVDMLEIGNVNFEEEDQDFKYPNGNEDCKVTLPLKLHGIANMEDDINRIKDAYNCARAPYSGPNSEIKLGVKEDYYTNKAVDVEHSEMIVSTDDDSCRVVEKLVISEEVHSCENSFAGEEEVAHNVPFSRNNSSNNVSSDVAKELNGAIGSHEFGNVIDSDSVTIIDQNHADPTTVNKYAENCSCVRSIEDGEKLDTAECVASDRNHLTTSTLDAIAEKQLAFSEELDNESLQGNLSILRCSDDQNDSIDRDSTDQAILEEIKTTTTTVSSNMEDSFSRDGVTELISTFKAPSGIITFTFDPQEASRSSRDTNREDKDIQQSKQARISPGTEDATFDGVTTSARTSFLHLMEGDSNFHGHGFLSGPIVNSGHIHSGSISIRSDSSTTSARSFAFPILHSEWNSSPVKMAKARRRGRKMRLFCCTF